MSQLIDQLAEQQILAAQAQGQLQDLPGEGAPLVLEDDSMVPEHLRAGYRLLKNAGYLPPELIARRDALELCTLLAQCQPQSASQGELLRKLRTLELKLRVQGMDTRFISDYLHQRG